MIGWLRSGRDAGSKRLTTLEKLTDNPADYDLVVVGTPVWNHSVSTPVRTYLSQFKGKFGKVAFFCTGDSVDDIPFGEMEAICEKKPVATLRLHRKSDVENNHYIEKTEEFVAKLDT